MRQYLYGILSAGALLILVAATPALFGVEVGGTGTRSVSNNGILVGRGGSTALVDTVIPSCAQLGFNPTTHQFVCNATSTTTTATTSTTSTT
jgi:hypothetical protein